MHEHQHHKWQGKCILKGKVCNKEWHQKESNDDLHSECISQSSVGDPRDGTVVGGQRRGKFGKFSHSGRVTGKLSTCITDDSCKTGTDYTGRVVNGRIARAVS